MGQILPVIGVLLLVGLPILTYNLGKKRGRLEGELLTRKHFEQKEKN